MREISERIRYLRESKGLAQKAVSEALGISFSTYQKYEYGQFPSRRNLNKLVDFFGCNEAWLFAGEGEPFAEETEPPAITSCQVRVLKTETRGSHPPEPRQDKAALLKKTEIVLDSETTYSKALAQNIEAFHAAVVDTQSLESRVAAMERKLERLSEAALEKDAQDADLEKGGTGI